MSTFNLNPTPPSNATASDVSFDDLKRKELEATIKRGTNWFYWIAALSLVNTGISFSGADRSFALGLGITQVLDYLANQLDGTLKFIPLVVSVAVIVIFAVFGYFGGKGQLWAIAIGLGLYLLDSLLFLVIMISGEAAPILGLIIHGVALYSLVRAFLAARELKQYNLMPQHFIQPPAPPQF